MYSYDNCGLLERFDNHFCKITWIHNYQLRLASLQTKIPFAHQENISIEHLCSFHMVAKFGVKFLKDWSLFHLIHLENNTEMSCSLANIPVESSFVRLFHFFCMFVYSASSLFWTIHASKCSPHPPSTHSHAFHPLCFCLCCAFATNFCLMFKLLHLGISCFLFIWNVFN